METYKRRLTLNQLFSRGDSDILNYLPDVKEYFFTESVRGGIEELICKIWICNRGKVLLPVFVAEGVIKPFRQNKIPVIFYKLEKDLSPDLNDITSKISSNPDIKSMVIIHYFGYPQDLNIIKNICIKHNIILFEDCAHALFSKGKDGKLLGMIGDISFFSFPKTLPVPDGAIFFINNPDLTSIISKIEYKKSITGTLMVVIHLLYLLFKNIEIKLSYSFKYRILNVVTKALYFMYYNLLRSAKKPQRISKCTLRILQNIDYTGLIERRKKNIKKLHESIVQSERILFKQVYNSNFMLTGVPIILESPAKLQKLLIQNNIECLRYTKYWFFAPINEQHDFELESFFYQNHLLFPIHEDNRDYTADLCKTLNKL